MQGLFLTIQTFRGGILQILDPNVQIIASVKLLCPELFEVSTKSKECPDANKRNVKPPSQGIIQARYQAKTCCNLASRVSARESSDSMRDPQNPEGDEAEAEAKKANNAMHM